MGKKTSLIRVSAPVKAKLLEIMERNGHTTMDSVLRGLLAKAGEELK
jgi:hypothetical protein